ncbi:MAG: flagellar biosynthesis protein FliQ [Lachnospiraceae bacterium]|nr:flagellar biosynthesis protein FliQ [Lachnospiraceae bacterium]
MNEQLLIDIFSQALVLVLKLSAPLLLVSLAIGLIISLFQTLTSIQESTLTFVPKLIGVFIVLMLAGAWILKNLEEFTRELFNFSYYVG